MILFLLGCKTVMVKHFDTFSLISHLCCHSCNVHKPSCNLSASSGVWIALYIIQSCVLFQHVNEPTRFRPGSSPHVLDLVLTNEEDIVKSIKYSSGLGLSDHLCLNISLSCSPITINQSSDVSSVILITLTKGII